MPPPYTPTFTAPTLPPSLSRFTAPTLPPYSPPYATIPPAAPYGTPLSTPAGVRAPSMGNLYETSRLGGSGGGGGGGVGGRLANFNSALPGDMSGMARLGQLGRGIGAATVYRRGGEMLSSALGGNETDAGAMASAAGTTGALGSLAYGAGSAAGLVGGASAAAVGGAAAAGGLIAEGIARTGVLGEGHSLTNVGGNIGRRLSSGPGSLGNNMSALSNYGIAPSQIAQFAQDPDGEILFAKALTDAGVPGAEVADGTNVNIEGDALAMLEEFRGLHSADDPFSTMMRDLIEQGADPANIDEAALAFEGLTSGDEAMEGPEAAAAIRTELAARDEATTAAAAFLAQQLLLQQRAQEYMAPVTGQMRQDADANYEMMQGIVGSMNLPPGMADAMLMQANAQRGQMRATAAAYDNQMMVAGPAAAQQDYQMQVDSMSQQLMQQLQAQGLSTLTDPMAQMGAIPYATAPTATTALPPL